MCVSVSLCVAQIVWPWTSATQWLATRSLGDDHVVRADVVYVPRFRYAFWSDAPAWTGLAYVGPALHGHFCKKAVERVRRPCLVCGACVSLGVFLGVSVCVCVLPTASVS
jgi:hypothetical protein